MKTSLLSLFLLTLGFGSVAQDSKAFFSEPGDGGIIMKRYIDVDINGTDLQLSSDWTIESMLRMPPGFDLSQMHIVECYDQSTSNGGYALRLTNKRVQAYAMSNGAQPNLIGNQIIPDDTWTHIAVTYNESTGIMSIYIDGILDNSTNLGSDQFTIVPTMRIGARGDDSNVNQFSLIDEVRIWNIAWGPADIIADMNACLTGTESGLLAYYTFENETGNIVADQTPNGNDGTIMNPLVQGNYQNGAYSCNDIIAIQAKGAYSTIYLVDEKDLLVSKNLKHFENVLPESKRFFRSHKSWIVNTDYIKTFNKNKGEIDLCKGIQAKLSRYRIQEFETLSANFK